MWDLKPEAPIEYRGEFKPIETNVGGHPDRRRAPAALGPADGQVRHRPVGHPPRLRTRVGQPLPADRLPPDQRHPRPGDAQLRLDRRRKRPRAEPAARPAGVRRGPEHRPGAARPDISAWRINPFSVGDDPNNKNFSVKQPDAPQRDLGLDRLEPTAAGLLRNDRHVPARVSDALGPDGRPRLLHRARPSRWSPAPRPARRSPSRSGRKTDAVSRPLRSERNSARAFSWPDGWSRPA